jgi:uncharacterized membrane protein YfcA
MELSPEALSPPTIVLLFFVALVAGLVDAIAGGGGLLTVPALMATGLPTTFVFGTNKGAAVFGSGAALFRFWRAGLIEPGRVRVLFGGGFIGSCGGAVLLTQLDPRVLKPVVLVLLVLAGLFVTVLTPASVEKPQRPSRHGGVKAVVLAVGLGAYDGFFGPGTGTFLIVGLVALLNLTLREASANAKAVNFASNLAALLVLGSQGLVLWNVSLPMAAGQFIGATIGASLAVHGGHVIIRRVLLAVVIGLVAKLSFELSFS